MKFDFVIGNPPYQEETVQEISKTNGQTPRKNIFHYYQIGADKVAKEATVLIYPAGRWIHRSGKGMEEFGLQQINDPRLKKIVFYPDSSEVFSGVAIADGVGIVIKDMKKTAPGFEYVYRKKPSEISVTLECPGSELMTMNPNDLIITQRVGSFAPYGFQFHPTVRNKLVIDGDSAAVVRCIFDMALQGVPVLFCS